MNFQSLLKVEDFQFYIDRAFKNATVAASSARKKCKQGRMDKSRFVEMERIKAVNNSLNNDFTNILKSFPNIDNLPIFYLELVKCTIDYRQLKKSLGATNWAKNKVYELYKVYSHKIKASRKIEDINIHRRSFYGRASSAVKQIRKELLFLEESRKIMKKFPSVKTGLFTVVIAGFPNVGKSTLLKAITGSAPKIAPYPFTTKNIMLGYLKKDKEIQFIDTPGLLDRNLEERNKIELQAILALKHVANLILFVIDPTPICGYDVKEQLSLLTQVKKNFTIPIIVIINKIDIAEEEIIKNIKNEMKEIKLVEVSAEKNINVEELVKQIV